MASQNIVASRSDPYRAPSMRKSSRRDSLGVDVLAVLRGAQPLRQRLQDLPRDGAIPFHQRAELPEREPVANQVGRSGHGSGAGAAVDQGDLAEVVARAD